jgi:ketosteroid isomerase-like protein
MSQENVQAVRQIIDRWNAGDVDGWLEPAHPDIEWSSAVLRQVEGAGASVYRGKDELQRFWQDWHELWDLTIEPAEVRDLGETVVVLGHMRTRGNMSGVDLERPVGYVFEFEDRLIRRARAFLTAEEALEAAGLRE